MAENPNIEMIPNLIIPCQVLKALSSGLRANNMLKTGGEQDRQKVSV
jgi:hypothetical protein